MTTTSRDTHGPAPVPALATRSDADLVAGVGEVLAVPRHDPADSFVLHAPLELVARAALLPHVRPERREDARRRITEIADGFTAFGPPVATPNADEFDSPAVAADRLVAVIDRGELDDVDRVARWLGRVATPDELRMLLSDAVVPRLAAAAHAPIFLYQLPRIAPRGEVTGELLRGLARELARAPEWRLHWIDASPGGPAASGDELFAALASTPQRPPEPGATPFIHPLMSRVDEGGTAAALLATVTTAGPVPERARAIQRAAAWSMLLEPDDHAPYGWSHCLTMSQAVLGVAGPVASHTALAIAATYVVGFRFSLARVPLVPELAADDPGVPLADALTGPPAVAAAAAWHLPEARWPELAGELATRASVHHDAHLVKYTLACLDAAAADPAHRRLYLAAAASLVGWWATLDALI
jgi:hypothetical protein